MANRFWVGNGGNFNDTAHWSTTSGGAGGASVPTSVDNAYFDALSFTLASQTVTVNVGSVCLDMDWTGATNNPTFAGASLMSIFGNLKFISAMVSSFTGTMPMGSTTLGKTITTAGLTLANPINFSGAGGGWTLLDNLTTTANISHQSGTLNTNDKTVTCSSFSSSTSNVRTLTLGASTINCNGSFTMSVTTNLTYTANTAIIVMSMPIVTTVNFSGGGLTFNQVRFVSVGTYIISGNNTIGTLTVAAGITTKLTSGTTQTVTSLVCNGTTANPSTLQALTSGSPATIALPAGRYFIRHTSIKDITITGATSVTSIAGTNVSGNTGITFVSKFEIGRIKNDGSFNWYNSTTGTVDKVSG